MTRSLLAVAFTVALSVSAFALYLRTIDAPVIDIRNIAAGRSQAPNQYRVLAPLLFAAARGAMPEKWADAVVILVSLLFCFTATWLLFGLASTSAPLKMVFQLALLGAFAGGVVFKYRDSFFEVGFAALTMWLAYRKKISWPALVLVTALGSLNRETYLFSLTALSSKFFFDDAGGKLGAFLKSYAPKLAALCLVYAAAYVGTRYYFGLSPYSSDVFMLATNLKTAVNLSHTGSFIYAGGGLLFLFAYSLADGSRAFLPFVLGYVASLLLVSLLISNWSEHRIFFAAYPLVLAHVLSWLSPRRADA